MHALPLQDARPQRHAACAVTLVPDAPLIPRAVERCLLMLVFEPFGIVPQVCWTSDDVSGKSKSPLVITS